MSSVFLAFVRAAAILAPAVRWLLRTAAAAALCLLTFQQAGAADPGLLRLRCTNPASGKSWPMVVDLDHDRVDALPATVSDKWISWHDPKQGFFDFDRATGKLDFRNASSTGGYFLHFECRPD